MMSFILQIECSADSAEVAGEVSQGLGAMAASIDYSAAGSTDGAPLVESPEGGIEAGDRDCTLSLLLEEGVDVEEMLLRLQDILGWERIPPHQLKTVDRKDWVASVRKRLVPVKMSNRLWIVPTWHEPPDPGAVNLRIDPGQAFGTGTHPTTRLCLEWLEKRLSPGDFVLDYGCGTGILAIAALKLGARKAAGVDIDPQALKVSRENAARNGVVLNCYLPEESPPMKANLVVANILANPLKELAPLLAGYTKKGGRIALSGILAEQAPQVEGAYREWFKCSPPMTEAGWALLAGTRR